MLNRANKLRSVTHYTMKGIRASRALAVEYRGREYSVLFQLDRETGTTACFIASFPCAHPAEGEQGLPVFVMAFSVCSRRDQFDKALGRTLAVERAAMCLGLTRYEVVMKAYRAKYPSSGVLAMRRKKARDERRAKWNELREELRGHVERNVERILHGSKPPTVVYHGSDVYTMASLAHPGPVRSSCSDIATCGVCHICLRDHNTKDCPDHVGVAALGLDKDKDRTQPVTKQG